MKKTALRASALALFVVMAAGCANTEEIKATADRAAADAAAALSAAEAARAAADRASQSAAAAQSTADQALAAATNAQACCEANKVRSIGWRSANFWKARCRASRSVSPGTVTAPARL